MLTNKYNFSSAIVDILKGKEHQPKPKNRYSITQLMGNVRESILAETEEPIEDISDYFLAFLGTCIHYYFENHTDGENELHLETTFGDSIVSGIIDHFKDGVITDYKTKKCSDVDYEEAKKQIILYAWLLRRNNIIANRGKVVVIRRDWSKMKCPNLPPIEEIDFSINTNDIQWAEEYVAERINIFKQARLNLPECSPEDKWSTAPTWAVYANETDVKAKKVFKSKEEAEKYARNTMQVIYRPGVNIKCENFCSYSRVCKRILNKQKNEIL